MDPVALGYFIVALGYFIVALGYFIVALGSMIVGISVVCVRVRVYISCVELDVCVRECVLGVVCMTSSVMARRRGSRKRRVHDVQV
jgi:hypothetical protein